MSSLTFKPYANGEAMDLHTDNPDQYAKTWFYVTLGFVVFFGLMVFALIFRY